MTRPRFRIPLLAQILTGLVLGAALGVLAPGLGAELKPFATAFVSAIKMVVVPLIFSAVTLGVYKMGADRAALGRLALLSFSWFYFATLMAILVGLGLDRIFQPGLGATLHAGGALPAVATGHFDWVAFLLGLIPSNIVAAMAEQKILPILLFASIFGLALSSVGPIAKAAIDPLEAVLAAMFRLTGWIVALSPVAVFAVLAWLFATQGMGTLLSLAKLVGVLYLGLIIIMGLCLIALAALGERPFAVARQMLEPTVIGFSTRSSEVALPIHMQKLEAMGVPNRIVATVLPLAYSFNLDGAALYLTLAVTFLGEAYGLHLDGPTLMTILVTVLIASKGVANVPSASLVTLATVLSAIGLPLEAVAVLVGVDVFMDMGRTAVNVFGNTVAVLFVRRFSKDRADPAAGEIRAA